MAVTLTQQPSVSQGDVDIVSIDYTDWLDSGELLTGSVTVAEQTTSDLTFANEAVNTATVEIFRKTVAIGKAVQFKVSGQQAGTTYRIRITVATDATIARTVVRDLLLVCTADS